MPAVPVSRATAWPSPAVIGWMRERIRSSGGDPALIPDEPPALWRLRKVIERTSLSRATLYRMIAAQQFPKPVRLSQPDKAA